MIRNCQDLIILLEGRGRGRKDPPHPIPYGLGSWQLPAPELGSGNGPTPPWSTGPVSGLNISTPDPSRSGGWMGGRTEPFSSWFWYHPCIPSYKLSRPDVESFFFIISVKTTMKYTHHCWGINYFNNLHLLFHWIISLHFLHVRFCLWLKWLMWGGGVVFIIFRRNIIVGEILLKSWEHANLFQLLLLNFSPALLSFNYLNFYAGNKAVPTKEKWLYLIPQNNCY